MLTFDSPSREFCMSRRIRTNTPLQALVTLNDPVYVEAAQALAQQMITAGNGDISKAIDYGYQKALLIPPDAGTKAILVDLYQKAEKNLSGQAVAKPIAYVENEIEIDNPMTVVANAIMNLDAFIMKE